MLQGLQKAWKSATIKLGMAKKEIFQKYSRAIKILLLAIPEAQLQKILFCHKGEKEANVHERASKLKRFSLIIVRSLFY